MTRKDERRRPSKAATSRRGFLAGAAGVVALGLVTVRELAAQDDDRDVQRELLTAARNDLRRLRTLLRAPTPGEDELNRHLTAQDDALEQARRSVQQLRSNLPSPPAAFEE